MTVQLQLQCRSGDSLRCGESLQVGQADAVTQSHPIKFNFKILELTTSKMKGAKHSVVTRIRQTGGSFFSKIYFISFASKMLSKHLALVVYKVCLAAAVGKCLGTRYMPSPRA